MTSNRYTPSCCDPGRRAVGTWRAGPTVAGFSLVELLVAMTVTMLIAAGALALALAGRRMYEVDDVRIRVNRSLRAAGAFLVADIHQAGERLGDDFPALEIVNGTSGAPDELILRRNLLRAVLRVCSDTEDDDEQIQVAWKPTHPLAPAPAGCTPLPDSDSDGWPDDLQTWKEHREGLGGRVKAYIYNPVTELGEPFNYYAELDDTDAYVIERESGTGDWLYDYPMAQQSRLYILEERRYRLVNGVLEIVVDGDSANPLRLVDRIEGFQVQANLGGTVHDSLLVTDAWYSWIHIDAIDVRLDAGSLFRDRWMRRHWSTSALPRNVLSK